MRSKNIAACIIVFLFSLAAVLGLFEAYLRIFTLQSIRPAVYKIHPVYGLAMTPGLRGYMKEPEYMVSFSLNSLGFRDKEHSRHKPADTYRIIGLGDSFSWGAGVEERDTFFRRMERSLNNRDYGDMRYEVFNWGVSAWGTAQELLCLQHEALLYDPDLVIIQYYTGNDMMENLYSALFRLDNDGRLIGGFKYGRQKITAIKRIADRLPFYRTITQHSYLLNFIRIRLLALVNKKEVRDISAKLPADQLGYGIRLTKALLEEAFLTAAKNGINMAVVVIPAVSEVDSESPERLMIAEVCRAHHVVLLDLTGVFTRENASLIYYKIDRHLTPYGHKVVAESVEKFLKEAGFFNYD